MSLDRERRARILNSQCTCTFNVSKKGLSRIHALTQRAFNHVACKLPWLQSNMPLCMHLQSIWRLVWGLSMSDTVTGLLISSRGKASHSRNSCSLGGCFHRITLCLQVLLSWRGCRSQGCPVMAFPMIHHKACGSFKCLNGHIILWCSPSCVCITGVSGVRHSLTMSPAMLTPTLQVHARAMSANHHDFAECNIALVL